MTNTSTARQRIAQAAEHLGWTCYHGRHVDHAIYTRGDVRIRVNYTAVDAVRSAERDVREVHETADGRGKRETVLQWLGRPADLDAPLDVVQRILDLGPVDDPFGPIDRQAPAMGQVQRDAGWVDPMDTDDEPADGTYPTLEAAEHGQPLASLDRLAELAAERFTGGPMSAVVRDHASTVRQRIAELEAQLERARFDLAEARRRSATQTAAYAEVRARVTELEDQRGPARARLHELVHELGDGATLPVRRAAAALARTLGTTVSFTDAPGSYWDAPATVHPDHAPVELVGGAPDPGDVRPALQAAGLALPGALLVGQSLPVREYVGEPDEGPRRVRIIGTLVRLQATGYRLRVGDGRRGERYVPVAAVPAYVDAVRGYGFPAPAARLELRARVLGMREPAPAVG